MITRSRAGKTLKKPATFGLVETPAPRRQSRKSILPDRETSTVSTEDDVEEQNGKEEESKTVTASTDAKARKRNGRLIGGNADDQDSQSAASAPDIAGDDATNNRRSSTRATRANGHATRSNISKSESLAKAPLKTRMLAGNAVAKDPKVDEDAHFEFGGSVGVSIMMVTFPLLMYYMWIGQTYYNGHLPTPQAGEDKIAFLKHLGTLIYEGAFPHARAWAIYWAFLIFEAFCYLYLPGIYVKGKPLPHEGGKKLDYYCSGQWSWYVTIALALVLHWSGAFKLYTLIDLFGPIMSVAIISGFVVSVIAYISALARGAQHRMTGYPIYDFFMGAELNPRLFGWLDFKMFFEVRLPWFMFFFITLGTAARQYEQLGYVSAEVAFLLGAHFLYANACCKGEELIVITWDMYYEKWGFMLIFWNMAGVPLTYCHCTIYLANHHPDVYRWNRIALAALAVLYLFVYWVWDTANSQKNIFRAQERGTVTYRKAFPQLPWKDVKNPKSIPTKTGDSLLCDGWYGKARKLHYTCDVFFAVTWALICGFNSPFPWFYPAFFVPMIIHRASRDIQRCKVRYGDAWEEYTRRVPWLFIPYVY